MTARDVRTPSRSRRPLTKALVAGSGWLGLSGFLAYVGYFSLHFFFFTGDDEGYWLTSIRSYHLHGSLYHDTFSQAGPFYYEAWSLAYSILGLRIDWDTGRLLTLIMWIGTSLIY